MNTFNIMTYTDSYKVTHFKQYPPDTEYVMSYLTARKGGEIVPFGFQAEIKKYLAGDLVTRAAMLTAKRDSKAHFGYDALNWQGWDWIYNSHFGHLPLEIRIAPEGKVVPAQYPLMTVVNTDPFVPWLPNYVETLLVHPWYPTTIATRGRRSFGVLRHYAELTGDVSRVPYKYHDFGFRGVSSVESAGIGGSAHAVYFRGSDTFGPVINFLRNYYGGLGNEIVSIPAYEHSTVTTWGRDYELDCYANALEQYPTGPVAIVGDSYDIEYACKVLFGSKLRDRILHRDGVVVVRPDSEDPVESVKSVLGYLGNAFGTKTNDKGHRELPPQVQIIQGAGIKSDTMEHICHQMTGLGWSLNSYNFGSGSGLLQEVARDNNGVVFKACGIKRKGRDWEDVYKSPKTDPDKRSFPRSVIKQHEKDMVTIFRNGKMHNETTFTDVRERAAL